MTADAGPWATGASYRRLEVAPFVPRLPTMREPVMSIDLRDQRVTLMRVEGPVR